jgi:hypothetical protein
MKRLSIIFIPVILAGFILPDDSCRQAKASMKQTDGPYVLYKDDKLFVHTVVERDGAKELKTDSMPIQKRGELSIQVATDDSSRMFTVTMQKELEEEKAEYAMPSKMLVISDIEGNFSAFYKLLLAGNVIDNNFNWTFGNGHLVLTGDFVDRGSQAIEVLWLIYAMEEKAEAAGGHVHYILGNHEIMNLSGDLRYLHPKYAATALMINKTYPQLIGDSTELGRWMRTKNVVEKIGDLLFTHGGVSPYVNKLDLKVNKINKLARPFYGDSLYQYKDTATEVLMGDYGPFWYRGYYQGNASNTIDSTLDMFKVKHIATGHTIIGDTISVKYDGKVFNTDVHHAKGKSEALYIEGGKFYRLTPSGEKIWLYG